MGRIGRGDSRFGAQQGISIPELLVVIALLGFALSAALLITQTSVRASERVRARTDATQHSQHGLARMTRELRQATDVLASESNWIWLNVQRSGQSTPELVVYACNSAETADQRPPEYVGPLYKCERMAASTGLVPEPVVRRVVNTDVFSVDTEAVTGIDRSISLNLSTAPVMRVSGGTRVPPVRFEDTVELRNTRPRPTDDERIDECDTLPWPPAIVDACRAEEQAGA